MVSIIVPVYNIARELPQCVESLLAQNCPPEEILLVDDGSTDESGILCDRYAQEHPHIRVIHKTNGGLSSARNAGLDASRGNWVLFVDGDDLLAPKAVETLLSAAAQYPDADFIQFLYQETPDAHWQPTQPQSVNEVVCTQPRELFHRLYAMGGVAASACTKLLRRELIQTLRFREGIRHEDEELMTRLLPLCRKAVYTDLVLYGYRMRPGSIVHSIFSPKSMDIFPILEARIPVLEELGLADLVVETRCRMFRTAAWQYCLACRGGFLKEAASLKSRLLCLARENSLPLSGQYRLLFLLCRHCSAAPRLYYLIRRLCGKS